MPYAPSSPSLGDDRDWLLALAGKLQRTLEVGPLLESFSRHTAEAIAHSGLRYVDPSGELRAEIGKPGRHSCTYDVVLPDEKLGTITFTRDTPFSARETRALENLLLSLVYPLRNALLFEEVLRASARDPLTGLGNRAALDEALTRQMASAVRHRDALSVMMIDVDHFKGINDRFGHLAGDRVLRTLAEVLRTSIRGADMAFRYGGEEFLVVLDKTGLGGALQLAERVRKRVQETSVEAPGGKIAATVSIGVATLEPGDDALSLVARADRALYDSKTGGRNRVSAHSSEEGLVEGAPDGAGQQAASGS